MQVNGRLTAPPQLEAALVTNSVEVILREGGFDRTSARGIPLEQPSLGNSFRRCFVQRPGRACESADSLRKFDPVSAAHLLSASQEAAAGN